MKYPIVLMLSLAATVSLGLIACSAVDTEQSASHKGAPTPVQLTKAENDARPRVMPPKAKSIEEVLVTASRAAPSYEMAVAGAYQQRAPAYQDYARDNYQRFVDNGLQWVSNNPVSTFAIDVDTASYANVRRLLEEGLLPNRDAVRVEEMINYFNYGYPAPVTNGAPFAMYKELGPSPWDANKRILHLGVNSRAIDNAQLPPANLVFLIDVSGSMQAPNKLHLLKRAMKMMVKKLRAQDTVGIVVYAAAAGQVLASTPGSDKAKINRAIDRLQAGGSTNGAAGIHLAYQMAAEHFIDAGINRVMLATDGDFNVGTTDIDALQRLVEAKRQTGVALSVLGFGSGNLNDHLMQKIAQIGDGNAAYIDSMHEARKVLVDEMGATLNTIAKDVKIQVEFNPAKVAAYRLIGYETRHLNREDFNNDKVDAGEVGEGHAVTALYELTMVGSENQIVDPLRYGVEDVQQSSPREIGSEELAFVKLRYKPRDGGVSKMMGLAVVEGDMHAQIDRTSEVYRFSAAVAWLGQLLRGQSQLADGSYTQLIELAQNARGADLHGYRAEFVTLVQTAAQLSPLTSDLSSTLPTEPPPDLRAELRSTVVAPQPPQPLVGLNR